MKSHLVQQAEAILETAFEDLESVDPNAGTRGLFFGTLLSAPLWGLIVAVARWVL